MEPLDMTARLMRDSGDHTFCLKLPVSVEHYDMNPRMKLCAYVRVYGIVRPDFAGENRIKILMETADRLSPCLRCG